MTEICVVANGELQSVTAVCAARVDGNTHAGALIVDRGTYAIRSTVYTADTHVCGGNAPASCVTASVLRRVSSFLDWHCRNKMFHACLVLDDPDASQLLRTWQAGDETLPPKIFTIGEAKPASNSISELLTMALRGSTSPSPSDLRSWSKSGNESRNFPFKAGGAAPRPRRQQNLIEIQ